MRRGMPENLFLNRNTPRSRGRTFNAGRGVRRASVDYRIPGRLLLSRAGYASDSTTKIRALVRLYKRFQFGAKLSEGISHKIGISFFLI
jgi:hypothetical protein